MTNNIAVVDNLIELKIINNYYYQYYSKLSLLLINMHESLAVKKLCPVILFCIAWLEFKSLVNVVFNLVLKYF